MNTTITDSSATSNSWLGLMILFIMVTVGVLINQFYKEYRSKQVYRLQKKLQIPETFQFPKQQQEQQERQQQQQESRPDADFNYSDFEHTLRKSTTAMDL